MKTRLTTSVLALFVMAVFAGACYADGPAEGTWKWTTPGRNGGQGRESTLKLKQEGEKLTGTISGRNNTENAIEEGTVKNGEVSFKVSFEGRNNTKITITYTGKLDGDTIKGKSKGGGANAQERDWEAKRSK
jgi:hypothetical protein